MCDADVTAGCPLLRRRRREKRRGREKGRQKSTGVTSTPPPGRGWVSVCVHALLKRNKMCHFRLQKLNITN